MFMGEKEVLVDQGDPTLAGLPEPGEPVFYPKVGHCVYRGLTEDRAAPGKRLVELEDLEEGSRILIPTERVPKLGLRPAGRKLEEIEAELAAEFEQPLEEEKELEGLIENLVSEGSPRALAKGLKRLHLLRQTTGLSREDEQSRRKIRSWLAAEVALSKDCTRAEAQALITRILQEAMNTHRRKEREEAKERRRQVKAQKAAEDAALNAKEEEEEASSTAAAGVSEDEGGTPVMPAPIENAAITPGTPVAPVIIETPVLTLPVEQTNQDAVGDVATEPVPEPKPEEEQPAAHQAADEIAGPATPDTPTLDVTEDGEDAPQTPEVETAPNSPEPSATDLSTPPVGEPTSDESPGPPAEPAEKEPTENITPEPTPELTPELSGDSTESEPTSPKSS